jgi:hypothetical protein
MSKITNLNIGTPGTATAVAATNTKFTDVATATGAIGGDNIRTQGVDRTNINASASSHLQTLYSYNNDPGGGVHPSWTIASNGTSAVPIESGGNKAELDYNAGIVLNEGDILRLHYTVHLEQHNRTGGAGSWNGSGALLTDPACLVFPLWDITSDALANYVNLPNQAELDRGLGMGDFIQIDNYDGAQTVYRTDGTVVFTYQCSPDDGVPTWTITEQVGHGMLVYQHPVGAGAQTVYGVKLHLRGQMRYQVNLATTPDARAFRVMGQFVGDADVLVSVDHKIGWIQLMSMHMRNG